MMLEIIRLLLTNFHSIYTAITLVNETILPLSFLEVDDKRKISFYFDFCCNMKSFMRVVRGIKDNLDSSVGKTQENNGSQNLSFSFDEENPHLFEKMLKFPLDENNFSSFLEDISSLNDVIINKIKGLGYWELRTPMFDLSSKSTKTVISNFDDCPALNFVLILKDAVKFKNFYNFLFFLDKHLGLYIFQNSNPDPKVNFELKKEFISIMRVCEKIPCVEEHLLVKDDGSFDKEKIVEYCKKYRVILLNLERLFEILCEIKTRHVFDQILPSDQNTRFISRYLKLLKYFLNLRNKLSHFPDYQPLPDNVEKAFMELGFDESEAKTLSGFFFSFLGMVKKTNNTYEDEFYKNLLNLDGSLNGSHSLNKLTCAVICSYFDGRATQMNEFIDFFEGLISNEKFEKSENSNKHEEEIKN